jgi:hypothetical protein
MGNRTGRHRWKGAASRNDYAVVWSRSKCWFARVWCFGKDHWKIEEIGLR